MNHPDDTVPAARTDAYPQIPWTLRYRIARRIPCDHR